MPYPNVKSPSLAAARRGRPPACSEAERAQRILAAAEQVFTTAGYGASTMEAIAQAAGMSKRTLYGLYPDKRALLAAVTVAADDFPWEDSARTPLPDALAELRHRLVASVGFALTPRQIRLTRLLIAEAAHAPDLANDFHERVMAKCQSYLIAAVEQAILAGAGPEGGDARSLALALLGAALSEIHLSALFGRLVAPTGDQLALRVDTALRAWGFIRFNESPS